MIWKNIDPCCNLACIRLYCDKVIVAEVLIQEPYVGIIFSPKSTKYSTKAVIDDDLDILKMKCIVIAKSLGWKLENIV